MIVECIIVWDQAQLVLQMRVSLSLYFQVQHFEMFSLKTKVFPSTAPTPTSSVASVTSTYVTMTSSITTELKTTTSIITELHTTISITVGMHYHRVHN